MIRRILLQVGVNLVLVIAIFFGLAFFAGRIAEWLANWVEHEALHKALIWGAALLLSLPFLIAAYRKLKALAMLLAEMGVKAESAGRHTARVRRVIAEMIPLLSLGGMMLLLAALSSSILPPGELLVVVGLVAALALAVGWRWFIRLHSRMQIALLETLEQGKGGH